MTVILWLSMVGCGAGGGASTDGVPVPAPAVEAGPPDAGPRRAGEVDARVADAEQRLTATDAGQLVWRSIEAHGGLRPWLAAGTIGFTFDYHPVGDDSKRRHTHQRVDLWSARAVHTEVVPDGEAAARFGWDGDVSWITPEPDAFPSNVRFWALTPYYFVGMPFVLGDPGARFERLDDAVLDDRTWQLVQVTYEAGTGDAPDDYYILYLDPETHRLHALRYVVSYPAFAGRAFEPGGHTPETLMRYAEPVDVDGLTFFTDLDTFVWDAEAGAPEGKRVEVSAGDYVLGEPIPGEDFAPPGDAVVSTEL